MSIKTKQLAQFVGNDSDLSDDDEIYDKQIKNLFPAINFDELHLTTTDWKGAYMELSNSLDDDEHPQSKDFCAVAMTYVMGSRDGPMIQWFKELIEKLSKDPTATLELPKI